MLPMSQQLRAVRPSGRPLPPARSRRLGRRLLQAGVISAGDMTTEGCTCKLAWLLARPGASLEKTRRAFRKK